MEGRITNSTIARNAGRVTRTTDAGIVRELTQGMEEITAYSASEGHE